MPWTESGFLTLLDDPFAIEHLGKFGLLKLGDVPARPSNLQFREETINSQTEVHARLRLGSVPGPRGGLAHQPLHGPIPKYCCYHSGSQSIPVSGRRLALGSPQQFESAPVSGSGKSVQVDRGGGGVVAHDDVQATVPIEIRHRNPPSLLHLITAHRTSGIGEPTLSQIDEEEVSLPSVPGTFSHKPNLAEVRSVLVFIQLRDRAAQKGQSEVVCLLSGNPAVRSINVEVGVVVDIGQRHPPAPTGTVGTTLSRFIEFPVLTLPAVQEE